MAAAIVLMVGCGLAMPVRGAPAERQGAALAESLFREAKQLAASGDYDEACPKFAESHRIDPQLGTLLHLATCHEQQGKTASAWAEFGEAAEWAAKENDSRRERLARERIAAIEPRLAHLMVELEERRDGLEITLDGNPLGVASLATPLPVDPGQHLLIAKAPDAEPWSLRVHVTRAGEVVAVRIPRLASRDGGGEDESRGRGTVEPSETGQAQRAAGWVLGGVGLAGLVVMAIFGVRASDETDEANELCAGKYCTAEGLELHDEARTSADVATVAFIAGLACLGTGLTLVLTAPSPDDEPTSHSSHRRGRETARRGPRPAVHAEATIRPIAGGRSPGPAGALVQAGLSW